MKAPGLRPGDTWYDADYPFRMKAPGLRPGATYMSAKNCLYEIEIERIFSFFFSSSSFGISTLRTPSL